MASGGRMEREIGGGEGGIDDRFAHCSACGEALLRPTASVCQSLRSLLRLRRSPTPACGLRLPVASLTAPPAAKPYSGLRPPFASRFAPCSAPMRGTKPYSGLRPSFQTPGVLIPPGPGYAGGDAGGVWGVRGGGVKVAEREGLALASLPAPPAAKPYSGLRPPFASRFAPCSAPLRGTKPYSGLRPSFQTPGVLHPSRPG
jgi:hypothetical protein